MGLGDFINKVVNPVRNSSGALNPAGIVLKCNPAAEQRSIISNGVKRMRMKWDEGRFTMVLNLFQIDHHLFER